MPVTIGVQGKRCRGKCLRARAIRAATLGPCYGFWPTLFWGATAIAVPTALAAFWYQFVLRADPALNDAMWIVANLGTVIVVAGAIRFKGWNIVDYFGLTVPTRLHVLLGITSATCLLLVQLAIGNSTKSWFVSPVTNLEPVYLLSILVVAPVTEELLMRGFMYTGFARSVIGSSGAILLLAVLFSFLHVTPDFWHFCSGLLYGWLRWRTSSVTVPILAHAAKNLGILIFAMHGFI